MKLTDKIKNADRVSKANNSIVQSIEHAGNPNIRRKMLEVSQMLSDIHKDCIAELDDGEPDKKSLTDKYTNISLEG